MSPCELCRVALRPAAYARGLEECRALGCAQFAVVSGANLTPVILSLPLAKDLRQCGQLNCYWIALVHGSVAAWAEKPRKRISLGNIPGGPSRKEGSGWQGGGFRL